MFVKQPAQKTHTQTQRIVKTYKYCLASEGTAAEFKNSETDLEK